MPSVLDTAGVRLVIESSLPWAAELVREGSGGALAQLELPNADVQVRVESDRRAFETGRMRYLTRGAWKGDGEIVLANACTAGFDLHLKTGSDKAEFTYRWRPPARDRVAARVLRSRFHLLARAVLMQYPALWWAGTQGRVPLHASACTTGTSAPLITAPSGVGRSTLVLQELGSGGRATGDNLSVTDGTTIWGLVEPLRVVGGSGRRMPHGRQEIPLPERVESIVPDSIVVLERGDSDYPSVSPSSAEVAARCLITSTYMAGELRRYWAFAATLSAGTGVGPPHPPITETAMALTTRLPCFSLALGREERTGLPELLDTIEAAA